MSSRRMERGRAVVALAILLTWAPAVAVAQQEDAEKSDVSPKLGTRTWVTTGNTQMNFGVPPSITILSELRWSVMESVAQDIHAEFLWQALVVTGSVGIGGA